VLVVLAVLWKRRGGDEGPARASESAAPSARPSSRIDVATVARGSIAGVVRDPAGAGIAGATVCGMAYSKDLPEDAQREPRCTETGEGGSYRLDQLLPASYQVQAQAGSFIPALYVDEGKINWGLELAAGEAKEDIDLVLRPGGVEISGVVKDIGGGTVAGAWLFARAGRGWSDHGGLGTARSAADGTFRMWTAPGRVHVTAQADGYAEGSKGAVAPGQTIEILLTPESVLAGRVVEVNGGAPVPGALVTVGGWGVFGDGEGTNRETAMTDGDGKFRLTRLAPARYKPTAAAAGRYGQAAESVLLGLGETVEDIVIEVHAASTVKGRVVLADGKTPCTRGRVALEDRGSKQQEHHGVDQDGVVEMDAVLPGSYEVTVRCSGQLESNEYPELVVVDGKDPPEQVWKVGAGSRVRGVVLAHDGSPVARAQVSLRPVASSGWADWKHESTDSDGRFEAEGLRAGSYKVSASADGEPSAEEPVAVDVPDGGEATVEIRLVRGGSVIGAVVDESGQPVPRVIVRARGGKRMSLDDNDSSQTLDDGTFELEGLRPGSYRIIASRERWGGGELRAPGKGDDDAQGAKVEIRAGGIARVRLVVESQTEVMRGRVVNADGQPVTDAFVDAERESDSATAAEGSARRTMRWAWSRTPTLTDTDGTFTIEKLSPGTYTVRAYRKGGGEALAENVPVGQAVTLTIQQTGSISGTATTTDGVAPDVMTIAVSDAKTGFRRRERFFRSGGAFTMRDLPAGSLGVSVSAAEGSGSTTVPLANGQVVTGLAITLGAGAAVTGRLVAADDGTPLAGYMVQVMPTGKPQGEMMLGLGDGSLPPMSGADGTFEIKNAPSGRVQLMAFPTNMDTLYAFVRKVVTLESGRSTDIGDVKVSKLRAKPGDKAGDFGFELKQPDASTDVEKMVLTVALVRADGPAAKAGMKVGDVIVSVDGQDVREDPYQYWTLSHVPPGTTVTFGLERGASVKVTAGPPRD
jgi:uncharacterized GH25 family protein